MAMRQLPVYKITIKDDEELGVDFVALTDDPAIERSFQTFSNKKLFSVQNEEKRIISGPLIVANLPIYRRDEYGEYYVVFDKEVVYDIVQKFFKQGFQNNVNYNHDMMKVADGVVMFESFIIDTERGIHTPTGFDLLPDGSWFGSYKIYNDEVWTSIKAGTFTGFSVEGLLRYDYIAEKEEDLILQLADLIQNL